MSFLTDYIFNKLGIPILPEFLDQTGLYHMADDGGVECEIGEFLYGLVRMMKPNNILETGLYSAISAIYMAQAVKDNGIGHIDDIEWEEFHIRRSKERLIKMDLNKLISIHHISSLNFVPNVQYELMNLDSEPQLRYKELDKFWQYLKPGGIIVIHDLSWDMGTGNKAWEGLELIKDKIKNHELTVIHFVTPRGLTLMRKTNYGPDRPDYVQKILKGEV